MIDVDKLEAGPDLDALIAEKVMGWKPDEDGKEWNNSEGDWVAHRLAGYNCDQGEDRWKPSEYIADAWQIIEKLRPLMIDLTNHDRHGRWRCVFFDRDGGSDGFWPELKTKHQEYSIADEAPLAICHAALKAVGA